MRFQFLFISWSNFLPNDSFSIWISPCYLRFFEVYHSLWFIICEIDLVTILFQCVLFPINRELVLFYLNVSSLLCIQWKFPSSVQGVNSLSCFFCGCLSIRNRRRSIFLPNDSFSIWISPCYLRFFEVYHSLWCIISRPLEINLVTILFQCVLWSKTNELVLFYLDRSSVSILPLNSPVSI